MPELGFIEILTILGFVTSIITLFFDASRKNRTELLFDISSTPLVTDEMTSIPGLAVSYCCQPIKHLTSTTIRFTNIGNQMLEMQNFAAKQPLCLTTSGQFFQGQPVVNATADNPNSVPSLSAVDEHTQKVVFDFLEPKKSFQLTLLHDGDLSVSGNIKTGNLMVLDPAPSWLDYALSIYFLALFIALIIVFLSSILLDGNYSYFAYLLLLVFMGIVNVRHFSELRKKIRQARKRRL